MRKFKITVNGVAYEVELEELGGAASAPDYPPAAASPAAAHAPATAAPVTTPLPAEAADGKTIAAPMPGTLLTIAVKVRDAVKRGQLLYVLEAMKMENEIKSGVDGTVISVSAKVGDLVNTGQVIMQLG
jgi:glutaconyl-CoA/methylmalonyl-CoA decarboxylase subunit gamma